MDDVIKSHYAAIMKNPELWSRAEGGIDMPKPKYSKGDSVKVKLANGSEFAVSITGCKAHYDMDDGPAATVYSYAIRSLEWTYGGNQVPCDDTMSEEDLERARLRYEASLNTYPILSPPKFDLNQELNIQFPTGNCFTVRVCKRDARYDLEHGPSNTTYFYKLAHVDGEGWMWRFGYDNVPETDLTGWVNRYIQNNSNS